MARLSVGVGAALALAVVLAIPAQGRTVTPAKGARAKKCLKRTIGKPAQRRLCRAGVSRGFRVAGTTHAAPAPTAAPLPAEAPGEKVAPNARCELVVLGPCSIYTEKFWELQAKYEHFENGFAAYPVSPVCAEVGQVCAAVEYYLYPDGTLGSNPWMPDPC